VADPKPFDAWLANNDSYFVFELRPQDDATPPGAAVALFRMRWEDDAPVTAIVISPSGTRERVEVHDLSRPGTPYTVSLADDAAE
jgi:hypothetical protein